MPLDPNVLLNWPFEDIVTSYTERDAILYALGLGIGTDPMDRRQLRFVYEKNFAPFPTYAVVLGYPGAWATDPRSGLNRQLIVHGEQALTLHRPLPPRATVRAKNKVVNLIDKGKEKGALVYLERTVTDDKTGEKLATALSVAFARGDGGFGGSPGPVRETHPIPPRGADKVVEIPTSPQQALLYRLNGDWNPLHADPDFAEKAGFPRPILHGLCTYGIAARAVLSAFADDDPAALRSIETRFSAPVYPGEPVAVELWRDGKTVSFRAFVRERKAKVLDNGKAELA
jgi:acyl dehydratase